MTEAKYQSESFTDLRPLQFQLIELLFEHGPTCTQEIIEFLEKPKTTLINNLDHLKHKGFIRTYKKKICKGRGCPRTFYKLTKEGNNHLKKILSGEE